MGETLFDFGCAMVWWQDVDALKGRSFKTLTWVPIGALDNGIPATVSKVSALGSGDAFPVGSTRVQYDATDGT